MMAKEIFLDRDLKSGGYYELSIQVCRNNNDEPIRLYTNYVWNMPNIEGPFDGNFNKITPHIDNIGHNGLMSFDKKIIPFMTYNIKEEAENDIGYNWFDICFYTTAIEKVFGSEYQMWTGQSKIPQELDVFFKTTIKNLYNLYPFELAIIDYEVSGMYYIDSLKNDLNWTTSKFFVGRDNYKFITINNKKFVTKIDDIY